MLLEEEQHRVWPIDHGQSDLIPEEFVKAYRLKITEMGMTITPQT
ncbi:MAG: hypothetical protein ACHQ1H_02455 [Nitrososphaerales archaeon]